MAGISSKAGAKEGIGLKDSNAGAAKGLAGGAISGAGGGAKAAGAGAACPSNCALLKPDSGGALAASDPVDEAAKGSNGFVVGDNGEVCDGG
jgi:hypothetical protein